MEIVEDGWIVVFERDYVFVGAELFADLVDVAREYYL